MNRIDSTFARLKAKRETALIAYIMAGDPSLHETEELVLELEKAGADLIELGVPFSDPIADGPVIQRAADRALRGGATLRRILDMVTSLRKRTQVPLLLMAYYNTIHALGEDAFARRAATAGADGFIIPDMPPEEDAVLAAAAAQYGVRLIYLVAPTSTHERLVRIARRSRGFLYYVSVTGITGAKLTDVESIHRNVAKLRRMATAPVAVGFGIAGPDDAARIARWADGVIVGSAIVRRIEQSQDDPQLVRRVGEFVRSLKDAMIQKDRKLPASITA